MTRAGEPAEGGAASPWSLGIMTVGKFGAIQEGHSPLTKVMGGEAGGRRGLGGKPPRQQSLLHLCAVCIFFQKTSTFSLLPVSICFEYNDKIVRGGKYHRDRGATHACESMKIRHASGETGGFIDCVPREIGG